MIFHVRDYREGIAEVTWNVEVKPEQKERAERGQSVNLLENRSRTIQRAKKNVTRKILWNGMDHLLTLTYRDEVTDIEQARRNRERFCDAVQEKIPGWKYLGVYEIQTKRLKRTGAAVWHSHLAVMGWQNVGELRGIWRGIVGEGNIQVEPPRRGKGNSRLSMARYLGKYLSKNAEGDSWDLNRKIYYHSKNVEDPPDERIEVPNLCGDEISDMAAVLLGSRGGSLVSVWESIDGRRGRVASFHQDGSARVRVDNHLRGEPHPLWTKAPREDFCRIGGGQDISCAREGPPVS